MGTGDSPPPPPPALAPPPCPNEPPLPPLLDPEPPVGGNTQQSRSSSSAPHVPGAGCEPSQKLPLVATASALNAVAKVSFSALSKASAAVEPAGLLD